MSARRSSGQTVYNAKDKFLSRLILIFCQAPELACHCGSSPACSMDNAFKSEARLRVRQWDSVRPNTYVLIAERARGQHLAERKTAKL